MELGGIGIGIDKMELTPCLENTLYLITLNSCNELGVCQGSISHKQ